MIKTWIFTIIFIFSQISYACPQDIQEIQKGQVANCTGLLFSPEASKNVDEAIQDAKYYKDLTERLYQRQDLTNQEISTLDKRLNLYMDQSETLAKQLHKKEKEDKWQKIIYFGMGVFATGIAVYGASQLSR